jgi:GT2 family glycosyltransferase
MTASIGVVAIGRNEGDRLKRCLASLQGRAALIVYVDSGSTDGSPAAARAAGAEVVDLDLSIPFTAARARNAGLDRLIQLRPDLELVQFVDGDCEVVEGWLEKAAQVLAERPDVAIVCGRRRERYPEASVYNRLCDLEWDTPVGEAEACGGDALMRVKPLRTAGGYRPTLIAGEEPELCLRLRLAGWKILRIDAEMTHHDAAMTRFGQWWKRAVRAGHAFAEVAWLHRHDRLTLWQKEVRSNWFWGAAVPVAAVAGAPFTKGLSLALLLGYPLLAYRVFRYRRRRGDGPRDAAWYAAFTAAGKVANAYGQWMYVRHALEGRQGGLIEYK